MQSGQFKDRITLCRLDAQYDEYGGTLPPSLNEIGKAWAKSEPISNRKIRKDNEQIIETYLFTVRPYHNIAIDWQIIYQNRVFTVRAIDRSKPDRIVITAEVDVRHDRT